MLPVTPASPQRCSASCSPTWRVAWAGVTAPMGSPTTAATPTVPSSLVRGTGDTGMGLPQPRGCGDRDARAWGTQGHGEGDSGARTVWACEDGAWGQGTARARGTSGHGDTETRMPEPRGCGDKGTKLLEPREHGDRIAGGWGTRGDAGAGTGFIIPCNPRGHGVCRGWDTDRLLPVLPVPAAGASCPCCPLARRRGHHVPPPGRVPVPRGAG